MPFKRSRREGEIAPAVILPRDGSETAPRLPPDCPQTVVRNHLPIGNLALSIVGHNGGG